MPDITAEGGSRNRARLRRGTGPTIIAATTALLSIVALGPAALAAEPAQQACLGHDIRAFAQAGAGFGGFVSGMATDGGVGDEIRAHLAGNIPDVALPNSCND